MTNLEGRSLDEALARARGLTRATWSTADVWEGFEDEGGIYASGPLPAYHASIDALLRDIEPVCRERGMVDWTVGTYIGSGYAARVTCSDFSGNAYAPTAAIATARVFYAVLTRGKR